MTGTKALLIIHAVCSVSKTAAFSSPVRKGCASRWLSLGPEFGCVASLSERQGNIKLLISALLVGDAAMPIIPMEFVDGPFFITLALACKNNASWRDTGYAEKVEDLIGVAVKAEYSVVESESVGVSSSKFAVIMGSLHICFTRSNDKVFL